MEYSIGLFHNEAPYKDLQFKFYNEKLPDEHQHL